MKHEVRSHEDVEIWIPDGGGMPTLRVRGKTEHHILGHGMRFFLGSLVCDESLRALLKEEIELHENRRRLLVEQLAGKFRDAEGEAQ